MSDAFDKYMEAARRRAARRPAATKISLRKNGTFSVLKRGRVVQSNLRNVDELDAFLRGFDPKLAERMANRDRHAALINQLVSEEI
jgi:hypothetical protein